MKPNAQVHVEFFNRLKRNKIMDLRKEHIEWLDKRLQLSALDKEYIAFSMHEYAKEYHKSEVKKLNMNVVRRRCFSCDSLDIQHFETYSECRKCKSIMQ